MSNDVTIPRPGDNPDPDAFRELEEDANGFTFAALLEQIVKHKDLILTIPADQEKSLRKGLARRKARDNAKLVSAGLVPDSDVLTFLSYPHVDEATRKPVEGLQDVRIQLGPRHSITVLEMRIPNNDF